MHKFFNSLSSNTKTTFFIGFILILISISVRAHFSSDISYIFDIFLKVIESIGLALIISSIFSYFLSTVEITEKIQGLLEDIVVSRKFLENLNHQRKIEALRELLRPSDLERQRYSNIENYYDDYVRRSIDISSKNIRTNYTISARAFYDKDKKLVGMKCIYSYRLFPSTNGYQDIRVGFDENDKHSTCLKVIINKPDGDRIVHDKIDLKEEENVGSKDRIGNISLKGLDEYDHLDIEIHALEYGNDHWFMYTFKALQPTDGFRLHIICDRGIVINKHSIFDTGNAYHIEIKGANEMLIGCHQWIREGVGLSVLVSIPHDVDDSILKDISEISILPSNEEEKVNVHVT